jgi:hypothetical protein
MNKKQATRRLRSVVFIVWLLETVPSGSGSAQVNLLTYHNDAGRTGLNSNETVLNLANVNTNTFGKLFSCAVDGYVYAQPLYVSGVEIPGQGRRNVLFVATEHNSVYAFDADSAAGANGGLLWQTHLGPSAPTPTEDFGTNEGGPYSDIVPEVGITGTPVIDLSSGTIFVDAFTDEGGVYFHTLHALNITNGVEQPHSPVRVVASVRGTGRDSSEDIVNFNPQQQLQRAALTLAGGRVYVAYTGYANTDPYHGWLMGFDAATLGLATPFVFNTTPDSTTNTYGNTAGKGGIWMSGSGLCVDSNTNLYFLTGNGPFDGITEYADSCVKLSTATGLVVTDYFAPFDAGYLGSNNVDLGSGGLMMLPDMAAGTSAPPHLLVGGGKSGTFYVLNRDDLGRFNPTDNSQIVQNLPGALANGAWSSPAYFDHRVFYQGQSDPNGMKAFQFSDGRLLPDPVSQSLTPFGYPGATPAISANGTNDAIVWALQNDGFRSNRPAILHAYDAGDLTRELYNSAQAGDRDRAGGAVKFTVPTVVNGKVYVGGEDAVTVFGLLPTPAPPAGGIYQGLFSDPAGVALESSGFVRMRMTRNRRFSGVLLLRGRRHPFSGRFSDSGAWSNSVARRSSNLLSINLESNSNLITGQVSSPGGWTADLMAYPEVFSRAEPAPQAGQYTLIIPGGNDSAALPGGDGFGRVTVSRAGQVTWAGRLADGTPLVRRTMVSESGQWPFYDSLYGGQGLVWGWLAFSNQLTQDIRGAVTWIKASGASGRLYRNGFTNRTEAMGSAYVFTRGTSPINFSTGKLTLAGGDQSQNFSTLVEFRTSTRLIGTNGTALVISRASGLFRGRAASPSGDVIRVRGAVLQKQNLGSGYYIETGRSRRVGLGPLF